MSEFDIAYMRAYPPSDNPEVWLALLDAAEAAHEMVYPGGRLDWSWAGSRLKAALDRFEFDNEKET